MKVKLKGTTVRFDSLRPGDTFRHGEATFLVHRVSSSLFGAIVPNIIHKVVAVRLEGSTSFNFSPDEMVTPINGSFVEE